MSAGFALRAEPARLRPRASSGCWWASALPLHCGIGWQRAEVDLVQRHLRPTAEIHRLSGCTWRLSAMSSMLKVVGKQLKNHPAVSPDFNHEYLQNKTIEKKKKKYRKIEPLTFERVFAGRRARLGGTRALDSQNFPFNYKKSNHLLDIEIKLIFYSLRYVFSRLFIEALQSYDLKIWHSLKDVVISSK